MTACATETTTVRRAGFTIAADGSYAACLAQGPEGDDGWYPERWTLGGPEPYTVPLPGNQPEEQCSEVMPLPDGRVLIRRRVADRFDLALLYPTGPGTGELLVGSLPGGEAEARLLPPVASGEAYALTYDPAREVSAVWLVHDDRDLRPRRSRRSRAAAGAARGWTGRDVCSRWTARWRGRSRRSPSTWSGPGPSARCCRSPRRATTGCCSRSRTAGC